MSATPPRRSEPDDAPSPPRPIGDLEDAYLRRAISELSEFQGDLAGLAEEDGQPLPVHPSGSPRAEIFMVKWHAGLSERQEGVAFFGRPGDAILKSIQRLGVEPLLLYGTVCAKRDDWAVAECVPWLERELAIVRPKLVVPMGHRALECMAAVQAPLADPLLDEPGTIQKWTPTTDVIVVPDIDESLDEQGAKRAFWAAFRAVGDWYAAQPPY